MHGVADARCLSLGFPHRFLTNANKELSVSQLAYCDNIGEMEVSTVDEAVNNGARNEADLPQSAQWVILVDRIRAGDRDAMDELYRIFSRGVRLYLCRQ